ncbi:MAG: hypothetical protein AB8G18_15440 [Gammaproteobacteria bacterium]
MMTQIMVAQYGYFQLAFIKFQLRTTLSLQQITRLLQLNLFVRRSMLELLARLKKSIHHCPDSRYRW